MSRNKPRIFVASSFEGRKVVEALQQNLRWDAEVTPWFQDVIAPSRDALDSLLEQIEGTDYAVFVFNDDDVLRLRGQEYAVARDNVVLELGLCIARLGRERTVVLKPRNVPNFRIPTDLHGYTIVEYELERSDGKLIPALGPAAADIKAHIASTSRRGPCGYLRRYAHLKSDSFLKTGMIKVEKGTGYDLLLHMFKNERIEDFAAFDLAFGRWKELLHDRDVQTLNVSDEIFRSMGTMFGQRRCGRFRRLLVMSEEQLSDRDTPNILRKIEEQEGSWRTEYPGTNVETRIYRYAPHDRAAVARLGDFARFQGDDGNLALVEATLKVPGAPEAEFPEMHLVTSEHEIEEQKTAFDAFWRASVSIADFLERSREELPNPAEQALRRFLQDYRPNGGKCALIIEAPYFDLRTPRDEDRFLHLDHALDLFREIRHSRPELGESLFLEAFINDFGHPGVCMIPGTELDVDVDDENECRVMIEKELLPVLQERLKAHRVDDERVKPFGMRRTRNRVTRHLGRLLRKKHDTLQLEDLGQETVVEICVSAGHERISLGYQDVEGSGRRLTAKCAALMAQHYYDLYQYAREKKPGLKELWIFDFNRFTERESVRKGAEAARLLYSWPADIKVRIVNCIYFQDGETGTIHVHAGP